MGGIFDTRSTDPDGNPGLESSSSTLALVLPGLTELAAPALGDVERRSTRFFGRMPSLAEGSQYTLDQTRRDGGSTLEKTDLDQSCLRWTFLGFRHLHLDSSCLQLLYGSPKPFSEVVMDHLPAVSLYLRLREVDGKGTYHKYRQVAIDLDLVSSLVLPG